MSEKVDARKTACVRSFLSAYIEPQRKVADSTGQWVMSLARRNGRHSNDWESGRRVRIGGTGGKSCNSFVAAAAQG
jgi:hypothetical protein